MFSFRELGRHLGAASLAGIVAGALVAGVLGRIAMRVAGSMARPDLVGVETANGNRVGEITFGGTLAIALFVGIPAGMLGAALFASAEPWLRRFRPWHGVIFGLAILVAVGFVFIEPGNFDFQRFGSAPVNVATFAALFVAFGAVIAWLFDRVRRAVGATDANAGALEVVAWLAAVVVAVLSVVLFTSVGGQGDPLLLLAFAAVTLVPAIVRWRRLPVAIAYAAFALPVLVGAFRTLTGIGQMLD
jgi:hypothetical protein